jgi:hypothetical protein
MNDQLAIYTKFDQLEKAASALQKSGYFRDVTSTAQAVVKVMAGAELGLPPFASMTGINIIQGKPVLGANILATLVKNDPRYDYQVKQCNGATCELEWFEDGKKVGISTFTWDEAKAAGLTEKDNWRKYPSDMLFARAISRGARRYAPGIFGGSPVYTPDEMGVDTNEEGMIEAVIVPDKAPDADPAVGTVPANLLTVEDEPKGDWVDRATNSKGELLIDLTTEKLSFMANSLIKSHKDNGLTPMEKEAKKTELKAITTIIDDRNKATQ